MEYIKLGTDIKAINVIRDADNVIIPLSGLVDLIYEVKSVNNTVLATFKLSESTVKDNGDGSEHYFNILNTTTLDQRQVIVCGKAQLTDTDLPDNIRNIPFLYDKITLETC